MEGHLIRRCIRSKVCSFAFYQGGMQVQLRCKTMQQARAVGSQAFKLLYVFNFAQRVV